MFPAAFWVQVLIAGIMTSGENSCVVKFHPFDQTNCVDGRHPHRGSSACVRICRSVIQKAFALGLDGFLELDLKELMSVCEGT